MAEDDQVNGRLPDELAERLGQAPNANAIPSYLGRRKSLSPLPCRHDVLMSRHYGRRGGRLCPDLAPFMNLLPAEIIIAEEKEQQLLTAILTDVGRHAYSHLIKFLNARPGPISLGTVLTDFIPPPPHQITHDQMVLLSECLDDAVDSIRDIANHPGFKDTSMLAHASRETIPEALREAVTIEMITPEMASTALTLLAASAFRRPPTRMVEGMMAASQEAQTNGADGDSQREGTEGTADDASVQTAPASDDSLLGLACSTGGDVSSTLHGKYMHGQRRTDWDELYYREFFDFSNPVHGMFCAAMKIGETLWELAMLMVRVRQSGDFMGESECTPLMEACAAGHEKIVRQMIPYATDLNTQSATQNTALIYASAAGHLDCVEVLLEAGETRGIDLDLKNENGHCALMEAASGGHLEIVKRLIAAGSASLRMNVNSEFKESPLTLAAYKGHKELVTYLLTLDLGDTREEELHTALMEASMDGHIEVADILLKDGAPVNLPSDSFESPLTLAACGGHADLVKMLLDAGASIEEPNDESYTPLMEAAREGHADVVRLLLDAGANVDATTEETGETAMTLAACGGFTEIVEMILEAGGDLELGANTPLMEAATEGHHHTAAGIIRMMKDHKHDKDQVKLPTIQKNVSTALVQAADNGHYQITRELASSGFVDLNFQLENRTALMKAAKGGYRDIIRFLVQAGADVNLRSAAADVTALSLACAGGHYDTVAELLQHHADPNVILKDGVTCVLEAARHGYVHIVELLLDYRGGNSGPKPNRKVATPRRQMAKRSTPASPAAKAVAAGAAAVAAATGAAPAAKVAEVHQPLPPRPVRPMLVSSDDSDSSGDYYDDITIKYTKNNNNSHHLYHFAGASGAPCARHAHLPNTREAAEYYSQHRHHAHALRHTCDAASSGHSAAAHAQHNAELQSALFEPLPPPAAALRVASPTAQQPAVAAKQPPAAAAAAAKGKPKTWVPPEVVSLESTMEALTSTMLAEKLRLIPADLQEELFAELDANAAPGSDFQKALVRTFLADETIVQRLAAGDTVSLNTKTGETSAGVFLPVGDVAEHVNKKVKGSLAAMRKLKKETAAARAETRLTATEDARIRAIEDEAVTAIRETFMVAKAQLTAAQATLTQRESAEKVVDAVRKATTEQLAATTTTTSATPSAAVAAAAAAAAPPAATPLPTKAQAAATINAAAAAAPKTKDPGAQASDMMKAMAQHLVMPQKDSELDPSQVESFHKFHNFLVRTAKGDNPPASAMGGGSSKDGTPYEPAAEAVVMQSLSDELRGSMLMEPTGGDPIVFDAAAAAASIAAAAASATAPAAPLTRLAPPPKRMPPGGGSPTIAEIIAEDEARLSSMSPSPAPSSPALPMMTASSDEFVSDSRQPVTVRRRSASLPHNSSDGRWPFEMALRHHGCDTAKQLAMQTSNKQASGGAGAGQAGGDAGAPPPAKRATGVNRQGGTSARTGTVEKRPLAATSTFDVDMQTESNADTPLTLACSNGHTAMVELLITRGANVHHRDKKGFTPLILAATGGHLQIVQVLLDHGANIETTSERTKDTALSLACSGGKKEVADMLLKRGANKEHRNVSDYTPLSLAASGGYVDICNMLLDAGAEINSRTGSKLGISPLMLAAMNGHKDATRVLLERGSDINAQIETNRNTALTLACFQGRTDVVRLLLQYHANVEHRAKTGLTPLMEAANGGYVEVGQLLLENYADPNTSPVPSSRDTALTIAADKGHEKFVDLLLKNGAQVDARNKKGCTALWLACHGGHLETVQTLVKHKKTNVEMEDNRKVSPLMVAFRKGHTKIVKFLVKWVAQFPGDAELCRYIQTVTEQDLMTRCHECMNTIVTAKDKQAAQANLAADALIAQIEAEEEQARSKKLSKQRQKEKKKQKKQEKKKQEVVKEEDSLSECSEYNEDEEIDVVTIDEPEKAKGGKKKESEEKAMVKDEPKKVEEAAPKSAEKPKPAATAKAAAAATPLAAASAAKGKARAAASAAAAAAAAAPPVEKTPEREPEKVEERIPGMSTQQPAAAAAPAAPAASAAAVSDEAAAAQRKTAADRRAANRRGVTVKNGPTAVPTSTSSTTTTTTAAHSLPSLMTTNIPPPPAAGAAASATSTSSSVVVGRVPSPLQALRSPPAVQQTVSMLSPLASPRGAAATQEEWVKANKKGRNTRNEKPGTTGARSTSASDKQKLTDPTEENALAMWNNIEASRRRMTTLTVSSPCIARVIGRGGANINAIREATGASIEVERVDKALSRRDNVDREICIRGTAETVRNAVAMINGLIAETDVTVNEIIRLVRNSASPSEQARIAPDAYTKMAAATATATNVAGRGAASAAAPAATTNVWQQRMAARQAQDAATRPAAAAAAAAAPAASAASAAYMAAAAAAVHAPPVAAAQPATAPSPAPTARSDASSPVNTSATTTTRAATPPKPEQQPEPEQPAAAVVAETPAPAPPPSPPRPSEEEQRRKAPGFARPQPTAAAVAASATPASPDTTAEHALSTDASPAKVQQPQHDSAPASPAPTRPTALPSTPLHDRVPDLSQHIYAAGDSATERPPGSGSAPPSSAPALAKQDSASALFNDSTFRSIAEIWGDVSGDTSGDLNSSTRSGGGGFGGAWDNALLLNSFNSLNLSKPDWADYTTSSSVSALDHSSSSGGGGAYDAPSAHHAPSSLGGATHNAYAHHEAAASFEQLHLHQQAQQAAAAAARAAYGDDPFATNGPRSGPLFARGANAAAARSSALPQPKPLQQPPSGLDSIFNNVAAALIHHQTGSTTTSGGSSMTSTQSQAAVAAAAAAAAASYYPSPSYTDPAAIGLSIKAYANSAAANGVAAAYQLQQQQQFARMQQQHAAQQLAAARAANGAYSVPAPPPGFNQLNPVLPPPAALGSRSVASPAAYYGSQMGAPQAGSVPAANVFQQYLNQPGGGWKQPQQPGQQQQPQQQSVAPPTMNGTTNGRNGGVAPFGYSNGWN